MQNYTGLIALVIYIVSVVFFLRYEAMHEEENVEEVESSNTINDIKPMPLDINDEDATVACLIAAIECRNEFHKNVQIVSIRRID